MSAQLLMALIVFSAVQLVAISDGDAPITRPNCTDRCGNVSIPFPFGIDAGCYANEWFEIKCKKSNGSISNKPYLAKFKNIEVMEVITDSSVYGLPSFTVGIPPLNTCVADQNNASVDLRGSPFKFLGGYNLFTVEGCSGNAVLRDQHNEIVSGCGTVCQSNKTSIPNNSCFGVECCQTLLPYETTLSFYHIDAYLQDSSNTTQDCLKATMIQSDSADQYAGIRSSLDESGTVAPVVLSWILTKRLQSDNDSHAECNLGDQNSEPYCYCKPRYFGNPYVANGCQVPKKCKHCEGYCFREWDTRNRLIPNSYYCGRKPPNMATILD